MRYRIEPFAAASRWTESLPPGELRGVVHDHDPDLPEGEDLADPRYGALVLTPEQVWVRVIRGDVELLDQKRAQRAWEKVEPEWNARQKAALGNVVRMLGLGSVVNIQPGAGVSTDSEGERGGDGTEEHTPAFNQGAPWRERDPGESRRSFWDRFRFPGRKPEEEPKPTVKPALRAASVPKKPSPPARMR